MYIVILHPIKFNINIKKKTFYYVFIDKAKRKIYNFFGHGLIAQLGERSVRIRKVEGSNPFESTRQKQSKDCFFQLNPPLRAGEILLRNVKYTCGV